MKVNWYNDGTILNVTITGKELWKLWHILNDYYNILRTNNGRDDVIKPVKQMMDEIDNIIHIPT